MRMNDKSNTKHYIAYFLIFLGILGVVFVWYKNSRIQDKTAPFSAYTILTASWVEYKRSHIAEDGRVIDFSNNRITTSEGQSYAMLRSVWIDDKETFDKVWQFTKNNLKRESDNLFGWKWGEREDDSWGFMPEGGENSASDADSDIALALIFASRRWGSEIYKFEALAILYDLWKINTVSFNDNRYLTAGNWADLPDEIVINPSYFSPYAWRVFAEEDKENDWYSLIDPAYELLEKSGRANLSGEAGVGLSPDWVSIDKNTGELIKPSVGNLTTNFSYDAMRVPFRIALDRDWFAESRATLLLQNDYQILKELYRRDGKLVSTYSHSGEPLVEYESPSMYAMSLGYFMQGDEETAHEIYQEKIINLYSNAINGFDASLPYYDQNLLWFGAALYSGRLVEIK
jgi:endoglucanase